MSYKGHPENLDISEVSDDPIDFAALPAATSHREYLARAIQVIETTRPDFEVASLTPGVINIGSRTDADTVHNLLRGANLGHGALNVVIAGEQDQPQTWWLGPKTTPTNFCIK